MVNAEPALRAAQVAPGALEAVRSLLNTWLIPNDTRTPTDIFDGPEDLRRIRDTIREAIERRRPELLDPLVRRAGLRPRVTACGLQWTGRGPGAEILAAVLDAVVNGTWARLKACPDCRWIFYDHTRNGGKRWCLMTAGGPSGRSCGSIAKVRAHRRRAAAAGPHGQ